MPLIPMMGISQGKPCAILITVSDKRYKEYMANRIEVENPIPAKVFKKFLTEHDLPYEEVPQSVIAFSEQVAKIFVWEFADFLDAVDIKNALKTVGSDYATFVEYYSNYLKSI